MLPDYAELHCISNFSFLRGASHPAELVDRARALGYSALAITDECSLAGVVRAHRRAEQVGLKLLIGAEFSLADAFGDDARLVLLATNQDGYGNLSELITRARRRAQKGCYRLLVDDLAAGVGDCLAVLLPSPATALDPHGEDADPPPDSPTGRLLQQGRFLRERFDGRCWLGVVLSMRGDDAARLERTRRAAAALGLPRVAAGDVHYHLRSRKTLQDTLTAIRLRTPVSALGHALSSNAEQHLRARVRLGKMYPPELLEETLAVAARCSFLLNSLRYEYPEEFVPTGHTPTSWLRTLTYEGVQRRYPGGLPDDVRQQIEHELALIAELEYEPYFLTVADIVRFARDRGILCQGRGSAANSAICYCLGITEVNPANSSLLFERFISRARKEPPDIDVDFEHQRREEVIQYLYDRHGRERAALTATVISYRPRSALRDVGRALGIDAQRIDQLSRGHQWWDETLQPRLLREAGFDPSSSTARRWLELADTLCGFPRHLSQHTGGFVIARDRLTRLVPVENAAMPGRSVIEWDKDDLETLRMMKVDVLALGMLSAIRRALDFIGRRRGCAFMMQSIPEDNQATYDMICRADTIGVFQIESRAQMSMLPRLRPREYYDLVIEVAIVRPGPIQGGMVHPYLQRRANPALVTYPHKSLEKALARTKGVPIFQEQVMQIAMLGAGFSADEADALRRAMAAWGRGGDLAPFEQRLIDGLTANGYELEFAQALFRQIKGFGEYGFPESHAASFAQLVYVSSWIKCHEPAVFLAALLNSQPMGFYAPAQLVRDARAHGVQVRDADVLHSELESSLEEAPDIGAFVAPADGSMVDARPQPAVRLGLDRIRGLSQAAACRLLEVRAERRRLRGEACPFDNVEDMARSAQLEPHDLHALARANALQGLAGHRVQAHWETAALQAMPQLLADARFDEAPVLLPAPSIAQETVADYRSLGMPMGRHPLALLRPRLAGLRMSTAAALHTLPSRQRASACGLVTHRQRPQTAKGVIFVTLEDETGTINVIVWPALVERYRAAVVGSRLMAVHGFWQRDDETGGQVQHLVARRIVDHTVWLGELITHSRDFH